MRTATNFYEDFSIVFLTLSFKQVSVGQYNFELSAVIHSDCKKSKAKSNIIGTLLKLV